METIHDLLTRIGGACHTIGPDETVFEAIRRMEAADVGALMVVENGRLLGIVSERDYARKVILKGRTSKETPVRTIMSRRIVKVRPDQPVDDCAGLMMKHGIRHLPVVHRGKLMSVLSIRDVLSATSMARMLMESPPIGST
jgi:CBS domain-containing protein